MQPVIIVVWLVLGTGYTSLYDASFMGNCEEELPNLTVGQLLVCAFAKTCWPFVRQQSANSRLTDGRQMASSEPTNGRPSSDKGPTVGLQMADRFFWELLFTSTLLRYFVVCNSLSSLIRGELGER